MLYFTFTSSLSSKYLKPLLSDPSSGVTGTDIVLPWPSFIKPPPPPALLPSRPRQGLCWEGWEEDSAHYYEGGGQQLGWRVLPRKWSNSQMRRLRLLVLLNPQPISGVTVRNGRCDAVQVQPGDCNFIWIYTSQQKLSQDILWFYQVFTTITLTTFKN